MAVKAPAALALSLRLVIASILEARTAATVSRPEPIKRLPLPVIEVPAPVGQRVGLPPKNEHPQGKEWFAATPRKDGRKPARSA
jgi:hypothetical protein